MDNSGNMKRSTSSLNYSKYRKVRRGVRHMCYRYIGILTMICGFGFTTVGAAGVFRDVEVNRVIKFTGLLLLFATSFWLGIYCGKFYSKVRNKSTYQSDTGSIYFINADNSECTSVVSGSHITYIEDPEGISLKEISPTPSYTELAGDPNDCVQAVPDAQDAHKDSADSARNCENQQSKRNDTYISGRGEYDKIKQPFQRQNKELDSMVEAPKICEYQCGNTDIILTNATGRDENINSIPMTVLSQPSQIGLDEHLGKASNAIQPDTFPLTHPSYSHEPASSNTASHQYASEQMDIKGLLQDKTNPTCVQQKIGLAKKMAKSKFVTRNAPRTNSRLFRLLKPH